MITKMFFFLVIKAFFDVIRSFAFVTEHSSSCGAKLNFVNV